MNKKEAKQYVLDLLYNKTIKQYESDEDEYKIDGSQNPVEYAEIVSKYYLYNYFVKNCVGLYMIDRSLVRKRWTSWNLTYIQSNDITTILNQDQNIADIEDYIADYYNADKKGKDWWNIDDDEQIEEINWDSIIDVIKDKIGMDIYQTKMEKTIEEIINKNEEIKEEMIEIAKTHGYRNSSFLNNFEEGILEECNEENINDMMNRYKVTFHQLCDLYHQIDWDNVEGMVEIENREEEIIRQQVNIQAKQLYHEMKYK